MTVIFTTHSDLIYERVVASLLITTNESHQSSANTTIEETGCREKETHPDFERDAATSVRSEIAMRIVVATREA